MHLRIDGTFTAPHTEAGLSDIARELVARSGLKLIAGPFTYAHDTGLQAIAILAESHVSIELVGPPGRYFVDVFTCAPFDGAEVEAFVSQCFGPIGFRDRSSRGDNLADITPLEDRHIRKLTAPSAPQNADPYATAPIRTPEPEIEPDAAQGVPDTCACNYQAPHLPHDWRPADRGVPYGEAYHCEGIGG